MTPPAPITLVDLFRIDFRTTSAADALNQRLLTELKFDFRYQPARLAMALSLAVPAAPPSASDLMGKPIRGETLFGQEEAEVALWVGLFIEHADDPTLSRRGLQDAVAAHWARGIEILWRRWSQWDGPAATFLASLANSQSRRKTVAA